MTLYIRNEDLLTSDVGSDVVALHVGRGECFGLGDVTADVWRLLERPHSVSDLCDTLVKSHEVEMETCRQDVSQLIADMLSNQLIRVVPHDR